jgi:hypothetical protein
MLLAHGDEPTQFIQAGYGAYRKAFESLILRIFTSKINRKQIPIYAIKTFHAMIHTIHFQTLTKSRPFRVQPVSPPQPQIRACHLQKQQLAKRIFHWNSICLPSLHPEFRHSPIRST